MAEWELYATIDGITRGKAVNFDFTNYMYRMEAIYPKDLLAHENSTTTGRYYIYTFTQNDVWVYLSEGFGIGVYPNVIRQGVNYLSKSGTSSSGNIKIERALKWTPPNLKTNINGQLKEYADGWVKIDGQLRQIDKMWTKVNGILREV